MGVGLQSRTWRSLMLAGLLLILTSPFSLLALAVWATDGSWEFSGGGLRYWLLVKGGTVDRLGLEAATGKPVRYVVRLEEGNDPGSTVAVYDSRANPQQIVEFYAERCRALGIAVKQRKLTADGTEASLVCEGDPAIYSLDDVWVMAERAAGGAVTEVRITAGPGLTLIYSF